MKLLILLLAVVAGGLIDSAAAEVAPRPTAKLTVNGTVVMPDGSPADDAVVTARDGDGEPPTVVRTDRQGRFQIQGEFAWLGCWLHARSSDGKFQTTLRISEMLARDRLSKPVEMKLLPAQERVVTVLADGNPVPGTHVVVALAGSDTCVETTTGADGKTTLRFPANEPVRDLVAWHATLGTAGIGYSKHRLPANDRIPATGVQLSLRVPRPHAVRVVDADD